jgi:NTE family protein
MIMSPRATRSFQARLSLLLVLALLVLGCASASPGPTRPPLVGIALGGGGARGFAEIGVLRVLEQEKIPIGVVVGTSVGSLIGALYADTGSVLDAEFIAVEVTDEDLFDYRALSFFSGGFVKGERLEAFISSHLKSKTIEAMKVPYAAVAVDLRAGATVPFTRGSIARAVHASCAIPAVFVPVEIDGVTYVDGGVTDPVPADVARQRGADVVIAVAIPAAPNQSTPRTPIEVAYHAVTIMAAEIGRLRAREADVVIEPEVGDVAYDDFSQKKRLIEAGEAAARRALPAIRAAIAAKSSHR